MSKKKWLLIIIIFTVIGVLVASKLFPNTVDPFLQNSIFAPIMLALEAVSISITTSPIWINWGHWIAFFVGMITITFITIVIWPRVKYKPAIATATALQNKIPSRPVNIPKSKSAPKTVKVKAKEPVVVKEPVKTEEVTETKTETDAT